SAGSMQQTRGGCQNAIASKEEPVAVSVLRVSVRGVLGDARRGRAGLTLVLRAEARRTVRPVDRGGQAQKADLSDAHSVIEGDRHLRLVRSLQRKFARTAGVDVSRRGVDVQTETGEGGRTVGARG